MVNSLAPYSNRFEQRSMPSDGQRDCNVLRWLVPGATIGSGTDGGGTRLGKRHLFGSGQQ